MQQILLLLALSATVYSLGNLLSLGNKRYGKLRRLEILEQIADPHDIAHCKNSTTNDVEDRYVTQNWDHFDKDNKETWQNHYQVQSRYHDNSSETVFLLIGGEGTSSPLFVCLDDVNIMTMAREHKALVIQSEHRFFGPKEQLFNTTTENYKYLTTEQALEDLAHLIDHVNQEYKFKNPKWVAFGGSYPGTMAALFRIVHPDKTVGNVASSAPLYPKVDFYEYAQVMEKAFNETSPHCLNDIAAAFNELEHKGLSAEGRQEIGKAFHIENFEKTDDLNDIYTVNLAIFDAFQGIVQYTYDGLYGYRETGGNHTVEYVCEVMAKKQKNLDKLFEVFNVAHDFNVTVDSSYAEYIAPYLDTSADAKVGIIDMRGWMWLSCYEWGWLQTTTNSKTFGNTVPIHFYYKICEDMFGKEVNANLVDSRIQQTLKSYGYPENFNATNVVLPNGSFDPWSIISSFVTNNKTHTYSVVTEGAAHCHDMYPPYENEPAGLNTTRAFIEEKVREFLKTSSSFSLNTSVFTVVLAYIVMTFA
ncbi:unnamed protein product [Bursaphelenchus okinawaensis]|uniref:Serine protease n=1 Tax=Bursaphelenchus okinawaensis TaxID=465554 RepID=A0A811LJL2_9BILA|nr:unnamed protein product [Bursaphelenchus okinawaensis]CAG9124343.1 unnamed protein product [Bursaphelenchus okinawaensis]